MRRNGITHERFALYALGALLALRWVVIVATGH